MNPWALLIIGAGILLIIMGVKGSYGNVASALTGKPYKGTSTATQSDYYVPGSSVPPVSRQVHRIPSGGIA